MEHNTNNAKYSKVKERVNSIRKFYQQMLRGVFAIAIVASINYYLNAWQEPWFLWVVFGVTLGIALKAIKVFGIGALLGRNWEERKIKELMDSNEF